MCGIAGIVSLNNAPPVEEALVWRMADAIAHRGPDDAGVYVSPDGRAALANRRLAIIDVSEAGHQPMSTPDGSLWIAYNGEVYNYAEFRARLEAQGHHFRSRSDTEAILRLYQQRGPEMLNDLRGMFALAIWDEQTRQLFLARDRIGVKPLYYTFAGGQFIFASEIKAILQHPAVERAVDEEAFYHFLSFLTSPAPRTLFKGIYKLQPGHYAVLNAEGDLHLTEYWDVFDEAQPHPEWSAADYQAAILSELRESIRYRMVSDVPFGVFLSGGIDSTTNLALMAEALDHPVQSFSIGYKGVERYNEFEYARQAAACFGAEHHETRIGEEDLLSFLPGLVYHQDEPIADPVCVPLYYVSKLARDTGTVVIQVGEGADELFAGYTHWLDILRLYHGGWQAFNRLPAALRRLALAAAPVGRDSIRYEYIRRAAAGEELFWGGAEAFGEARKARLLHPDLRARLGDLSSWDVIRPYREMFERRTAHLPGAGDYVNWMAYLDLRLRLPELLLMRVDKMSMATSVEARVPYLDHKFVGLVMSIPERVKLNGTGTTKYLFKETVRGLIPDEIIDRPKQGFAVPVDEWLRTRLGSLIERKLTDFAARTGYFDPAALRSMLASHDYLTWYLLNFVLWHELWIESPGPAASATPSLGDLGLGEEVRQARSRS
ncbi:MAG TPA: asparagine synthase (glutamine-hydrolyzing) [Aggregatilineales bacterium]|nr:asparagine synthase (glutamine-hydrolyzing) [Aggregatilineales bacterium]